MAVETGDVVLMKSDPRDVLTAIQLSKAAVRKMRQNLFWAAVYNVIAIPVAANHQRCGAARRPGRFGPQEILSQDSASPQRSTVSLGAASTTRPFNCLPKWSGEMA